MAKLLMIMSDSKKKKSVVTGRKDGETGNGKRTFRIDPPFDVRDMQKKNYDSALGKGLWRFVDGYPHIVSLIGMEISEAFEAIENNDRDNFPVEMADVLIMTMSAAGELGFDLQDEIEKNPFDEDIFSQPMSWKICKMNCELFRSLQAFDWHDMAELRRRLARLFQVVLVVCWHCKIDIRDAVLCKYEINLNRPYMHGRGIHRAA